MSKTIVQRKKEAVSTMRENPEENAWRIKWLPGTEYGIVYMGITIIYAKRDGAFYANKPKAMRHINVTMY
jgi:hypothetical protein